MSTDRPELFAVSRFEFGSIVVPSPKKEARWKNQRSSLSLSRSTGMAPPSPLRYRTG